MNEAPLRRITLADVGVYRRFGGDLDGYVRTACPEPRVPDDVWMAIDTLRQRLRITALGLGAPGYAADLEADFDSWAADDAARAALRALGTDGGR